MYLDTKNNNECSGCTACANACPSAAIRMVEDKEGFRYPLINEETCIDCGLCRRVCSWEHPQYENTAEPLIMAAVLKNKSERQRSTSGGLFFAVAKWVLDKGGIVYGAAFDERLHLHHIGVDTIDELQKLRGSKYIQSDLDEIFKDVRVQLGKGRWCYFTGTGCQVAGLKAFLRKDYPTLITSDLVCHGVPSQKLFSEHISYLEHKYHDDVVGYQFRDNKSGGGCEICIFANRKPVINPTYEISPFLYSFMYGYTHRNSCYECKFAKVPRQGDITLADYWGVKHFFPHFDNTNGCSLLLLNTEKGKIIWEQIKERCDFEVSNIRNASEFNVNLTKPSTKPEIRNNIFQLIEMEGYENVANHYFRSPNYLKVKIINCLLRIEFLKPLINIYRKILK